MTLFNYEELEKKLCEAASFCTRDELIAFMCRAEEIIDNEANPFSLQKELQLLTVTRRTDEHSEQDNYPPSSDAIFA